MFRVPYFGVLIIRILVFRVPYEGNPQIMRGLGAWIGLLCTFRDALLELSLRGPSTDMTIR